MQNTSEPHQQRGPHPHASSVDVALAYARKGWRVFPLHSISPAGTCTCGQSACRNPGKHPITMRGVADATSNAHTIKHWWYQEPAANIGIATGRGLLVIDIDFRHRSLEPLMEFYALPETAMVHTGSGGWHLYFTYNQAFELQHSCGKLGWGINSQGEGDYVVAPPGKHVSGNCYAWLNTVAPAPLPAVLLPILLSRHPTVCARPQISRAEYVQQRPSRRLINQQSRLCGKHASTIYST